MSLAYPCSPSPVCPVAQIVLTPERRFADLSIRRRSFLKTNLYVNRLTSLARRGHPSNSQQLPSFPRASAQRSHSRVKSGFRTLIEIAATRTPGVQGFRNLLPGSGGHSRMPCHLQAAERGFAARFSPSSDGVSVYRKSFNLRRFFLRGLNRRANGTRPNLTPAME